MPIHSLYRDFLIFLDRLAESRDDPWDLYEAHYLNPHRAVLDAYWEQVLGLPLETWQARLRDLQPEQYHVLRALLEQEDPEPVAARALEACGRGLREARGKQAEAYAAARTQAEAYATAPEVYLLVGFFSPDAFVFRVGGEWSIGVGLERFGDLSRLPILIAHEYAHCLRRSRFPVPRTLRERLIDEGLAAHFSQLVFPDRAIYHHLLMTRGEYNSLLAYAPRLLAAVAPHLDSTDPEVLKRFLFGRMKDQPARAGCFLGYRMVEEKMRERGLDIREALSAELV